MRHLLATLALALTLAGCTSDCCDAQTVFDHLDEARARINLGHRKLAIEAIDKAIAMLDESPAPEPDPEPEPEPDPDPPAPGDVVPLPSPANPEYWLLDKVDGGVNYSLLDNPKVDGLSIRIRWSTINANPGIFNWAPLDKLIGEARSRNKPYTLRVMGGNGPSFVPRMGGYPIPWDDKTTTAFDALALALGQKYASDPLLKMVHVPGFGDSAEMHIPSGVTWPTAQMVDAWCHRIDVVAAAFPRQLICLNHSPEPFSPAVRQWMLSRPNLGKSRACFQMNALKASTSTTWEGYTVLRSLHGSGWPIGFQNVGPSTNTTRFGGSFEQGLNKGEDAGMRWLEFYQPDIGKLP